MAKTAVLYFEGKPEELVLLEIQSTVLMEDGSSLVGEEIGLLEVKGSAVTLTMGPRCLHGKLQDLKAPLVLMERTGQEESLDGDPDRKAMFLAARGVVRKKAIFSQRPHLSVS
eukprot:TRINITY_DN78068_c0_g1_i1.p1 TRINITY_DN78068_c0_g1~~TRINITY_DN78068_c0_g1_i1.p1  ORF type:complete len:123 (+),score=32.08 TRINITY_DN78068_c0_g1_i1:33-371(+)